MCGPATQGAPREGGALLTGLLLCPDEGAAIAWGPRTRTTGCTTTRCYGEPPARRACTMLPGRAIDHAVEQVVPGYDGTGRTGS